MLLLVIFVAALAGCNSKKETPKAETPKEVVEKNILAGMETPAKVVAAITMGQGDAGIVEISNTVKAKDKIEVWKSIQKLI